MYKKGKRKVKRRGLNAPSPSALLAKKVFIIVFFLIAQILFYYSDFFKLKKIQIYGIQRVSKEEILQTANIPLGRNIITLPLSQIQRQIKTIHWIKDVKVKWALPGIINIYVTERIPEILIRQNGKPKYWYASDKNGIILYKASNKELSLFPRLVVEDEVEVEKKVPKEKVKIALSLDKNILPKIKKKVAYYMVDDRHNAYIFLRRKNSSLLKVKVGDLKKIKRKMEVLDALLDIVNEKKLNPLYIDVRYDLPVISTPKKEMEE